MNIENTITKKDGLVAIHRIKKPENGLVRIRQSEYARKMAEGLRCNDNSNALSSELSNIISLEPSVYDDVSDTKKAKKKDKKSKIAKKKAKKKLINAYSKQLDTSSRKPNNGKLLAKILTKSAEVRVVGNKVYMYDSKEGLFKLSDKLEVTTHINTWLDTERDDAYKFSSRDTDEAYRCLITNASIRREALESAYNKPYVLCQNGVLELPSMRLLPFSSKYEFTSGINASYDESARSKYFKEFVDFATNGDKELKNLIQEIMGYALSNYSNKRTAFVFSGVTGTGKSTILDVMRQMIGMDMICEVPLNMMENEYYAATILSSKLNIVPDHNDAVIRDVAKFKSFVSDTDVITGRNPCERPFAERCRTKMLMATNHHFRFSGVKPEDLEAFFDRILFVPFNRKIENKIDSFWEKLIPEYDYIFSWAMKGLKRLIERNFEFTISFASEKMKMEARAQCNPEEAFFENCLKIAEDRYESSSAITEAFRYFCNISKIDGNFNITSYLEKKNIPKLRKRIDDGGYISSEGNPIYVYEGIRLRNRYRVS